MKHVYWWRATISTILNNATAQYFPVATHATDIKQFKFNITCSNESQYTCFIVGYGRRPRDLESFKGGKFNTLSLVDCYVQICNGTAVEHGSLLNCSGVCNATAQYFPVATHGDDTKQFKFNITCSNESQYTCFIVGYGRR
jgi:hypothetical protein